MTNSFDELEQASCLFVIGSNTTVAHPMVGMRLMHCHREGGKLIVADPRRTDLARLADVHLRLRPGTDVPLVNGLMHIIYENGWHDAAFIAERTENFDELRESLREWTPERTEEVTGVPRELLFRAAELYARSETSAIVYCLGITQHRCGVNNVRSLANLSMLCGQIGRPCTGVNPLRGQNNVQGACDMGGLPNYYPGYQFVDDEKARLKFEAAWGRSLSPFRGLTAMEMMHGLQEGKLKAMIIMGENPVVSDPDSRPCGEGPVVGGVPALPRHLPHADHGTGAHGPARCVVRGDRRYFHQLRAPRAARAPGHPAHGGADQRPDHPGFVPTAGL